MSGAPSGRLRSAVPIIPARATDALAGWYRDELGFAVVHVEEAYGIVERDDVQVHFWGPSGIPPEESSAMIRIGVEGLDALHDRCAERGIVHPNGGLGRRPWGLREFAVLDGDGNLVTFFEQPLHA